MQSMWSLDDLYNTPEARESDIGIALFSTAHTSATAQRLYLKHGYVLDEKFRYYHRKIA